jgi:hypothetical protein
LLHCPPLHRAAALEAQAAARFNLVPSSWDVFNFTAVEGMASGRPTIVSSGAGASELITHGTDGFVFEAGNASSLASTIEQVMALSDEHAQQIGKTAKETIRRALAPGCIVQQRIAAYHSTIEEWPTKPRISQSLAGLVAPSTNFASSKSFLEAYTVRRLSSHLQERLVRRTAHFLSRMRFF